MWSSRAAVVVALTLGACADARHGPDADPVGGGIADAAADGDPGRPGLAPGAGVAGCAASGRSFAGGNQHVSCLGGRDVGGAPRRAGGVVWQPGPLHRVVPGGP